MALEQVAASVPPVPATAGVVVSLTLSASALLAAFGTLLKVGRWMGHVESTQTAQTKRLDEIHSDIREIRSVLIAGGR